LAPQLAFFRTDTAYWVEPWLILAHRALAISIVGSLVCGHGARFPMSNFRLGN
jgi:hypothetical protein